MRQYEKEWFNIEPIEIMTPNGVKTVTRLHYNGIEPTLHLVFSDGNNQFEIDCTFNHPLRTIDGIWVNAEDITEDMIFDNNYSLISSLMNEDEIPTFDFEVPDEHCYLLESGIVSHNTAVLMGNVSEGINPDPGMTFTQMTPAGEVERINGELVQLMRKKEIYTKKHIQEVIDADGSVQGVDWLSNEEKLVFKTAFEINQEVIIRLASQRQQYIDQGQSLNLFFDANEEEVWISHIHKLAFEDKWLKGLYYIHSKSGVKASKDCESCS